MLAILPLGRSTFSHVTLSCFMVVLSVSVWLFVCIHIFLTPFLYVMAVLPFYHFVFISIFQQQTMSVIDGVTLVVTASVDVIQDGDTYDSLLECANILIGEFLSTMLICCIFSCHFQNRFPQNQK